MKKISFALAMFAVCAGSFKVYNQYGTSSINEGNLLLAENVLALSDCAANPDYATCYDTMTTQESVQVLYCSNCTYYPDSAPRSTSGTSVCKKSDIKSL